MNNGRQTYYRPPAASGRAQARTANVRAEGCSTDRRTDTARTACCNASSSVEAIRTDGCGACTRADAYQDMPGFPLAMAYVPWQPWCNLYRPEQALSKGTLFQELDLDFVERRCN